MKALGKIFILNILLEITSMLSVYTNAETSSQFSAEPWFENLSKSRQKAVKIEFYIQDILVGSKRTVFKVCESNITSISPAMFGLVQLGDGFLTSQPEPDSPSLSRAQGFVIVSDMFEAMTVFVNADVVFKGGPYNGSTLSISGRNPLLNNVRELSIVGGTGQFRMARGIAVTTSTSAFTSSMDYAIFKYTLYVTYPSV